MHACMNLNLSCLSLSPAAKAAALQPSSTAYSWISACTCVYLQTKLLENFRVLPLLLLLLLLLSFQAGPTIARSRYIHRSWVSLQKTKKLIECMLAIEHTHTQTHRHTHTHTSRAELRFQASNVGRYIAVEVVLCTAIAATSSVSRAW